MASIGNPRIEDVTVNYVQHALLWGQLDTQAECIPKLHSVMGAETPIVKVNTLKISLLFSTLYVIISAEILRVPKSS